MNVSLGFSDSCSFAARCGFFWIALVNSKFLCFPASSSVKTESFVPHWTRNLSHWIKSPMLYRLSYRGSKKCFSPCFLLLIWMFSLVFFYSFTFGALHDIFITLVYSEVVYFTVSSLWKQSFLPRKGLAPLAAGLKDQRSSDPSGGARTEACLIVPCCWLERSHVFLVSYTFAAHLDSFFITLVYSEFLCFPASSCVIKESFRPTSYLKPWPFDQKSNSLPTKLAGLAQRLVTLFPAGFFFKLTFLFVFTTPVVLRLTVVFSGSH